ncbi:MAG: hypothetical protein PHW00_05670 [Clostridia bacterium]|nr:hypothetical protein [Clostridia bacterium]MDD3832124.1 hypothetical protein [Clostridia bacterium]
MTEQEIRARMNEAFREDRERFFKVADSIHLQPKYAEHLTELEQVKQQWRDIPAQADYPNFTHPVELPSWFPTVKFTSSWEKDTYIADTLLSVAQ